MNGLPRRLRRLGAICLAAAVCVSVIALLLGRYVDASVPVGVAVSSLVLSWAVFRADRVEKAKGISPVSVADQLAEAVRRQWLEESRVRRLNDPYPLPVPWEAATEFDENGQYLTDTAHRYADGVPAACTAGPESLTADDGDLARVFGMVPSGRLVVLGDPGSGKTMLLVNMVLALLAPAQRASGSCVPVLLSAASWNPTAQDLHTWIAEQLVLTYPGLGEPAQSVGEEVNRAQALLAGQLLLPILDGLDEIPADVRGSAIDQINASLQSGDQLIVSSRPDGYPAASGPAGDRVVVIHEASVVVLRPLSAMAAVDYLVRDSEGPQSASRWEPVLAVLTASATSAEKPPVVQALSTPLALGLARVIYNPRQNERMKSLPDPAELCDTRRFPSRKDVEKHLFDSAVPAAYRSGPDHSSRWTAHQAERYLTFIARRLQDQQAGIPDIAWWALFANGARPTRGLRWSFTRPDYKQALVAAAVVIVVGLLFGFTVSPEVGVSGAAGISLVLGLSRSLKPALTDLTAASSPGEVLVRDRGTFLTLSFAAGPLIGVAVDTIVGLTVGPAHTGIGPGIGLTTGLVVGPAAFLVFGVLTSSPAYGFLSGVVIGIADWLVSWLLGQFMGGLTAQFISGALIGAVAGMLLAFRYSPWGAFTAQRCWRAIRGQLPWRLMDFLSDAHRRDVLRQVAAVYQFRHARLQQCLAARHERGT
jgi:hypothetical protein